MTYDQMIHNTGEILRGAGWVCFFLMWRRVDHWIVAGSEQRRENTINILAFVGQGTVGYFAFCATDYLLSLAEAWLVKVFS